ncbi:hypothetical protein KM043_002236 [Ampulex compressa]|nr:hypothetical protein KM043_002236 [Ampulex compressa]
MPEATLKIFNGVQYMGSFPVAIPDIASRAEFVRSQLETLRVSTFSKYRTMVGGEGKKKRKPVVRPR